MLLAPAALLAAASVLNGVVDCPVPAEARESSTYHTMVPTLIVTVPVSDFGFWESSSSVTVYVNVSAPEKPALGT